MPFIDISYFVIQPEGNEEFKAEWKYCLDQLAIQARKTSFRIFKLNVFVYSTDIIDYYIKKRYITNTLSHIFGEECPPFGVLSISPEKPVSVSIEAGIIRPAGHEVIYRKYKKWRYVLIEKDDYKELWANGLECPWACLNTWLSSVMAFKIMRRILFSENMNFDSIVQQWNYVGSILSPERQNPFFIQTYYVFNRVRFSYYKRYREFSCFPAATGIGMKFHGLMVDFCAVTPGSDIRIISVENPRQLNPYHYDKNVLRTSVFHAQKQVPLFDRAKLLVCKGKSRLLVSGTASIVGQETIGKSDIQKQTSITIENIEKLINNDNLLKYCGQTRLNKPDKYKRIRVYVKNAEDIPKVRSICSEHFGNVPAIYVQTQICRTDLLVEIEAELHS